MLKNNGLLPSTQLSKPCLASKVDISAVAFDDEALTSNTVLESQSALRSSSLKGISTLSTKNKLLISKERSDLNEDFEFATSNDKCSVSGIFTGCVFALDNVSTQLGSRLRKQIVKNGGVVSFGVSEHVTALLVAQPADERKPVPFKQRHAARLDVPVILLSYISACIDAETRLPFSNYRCLVRYDPVSILYTFCLPLPYGHELINLCLAATNQTFYLGEVSRLSQLCVWRFLFLR